MVLQTMNFVEVASVNIWVEVLLQEPAMVRGCLFIYFGFEGRIGNR